MENPHVRVRFAPSPTGALHLGSARTALFNWLFARRMKGAMILRIEDTDRTRSTEASLESILDGLRWLGIDWDEGPGAGGEYGPYFQSERYPLYREFAAKLEEKGLAYRCYCTPEELAARKEAMLKAGQDPKYDRKCLGLSKEEARTLEAEGRPYVLRFYSSDEGETVVSDLIRGEMRFANKELDDFVIIRSDGTPTYNFAVVVDDHLMRISHVIRGEDHISNTPRQVQVYEALDLPVPKFAHLPVILGHDKQKLSKRHGAKSVMEYAEAGYLPEALMNFLALLGWAYDDSQEIFRIPDELIEKFDLSKVSKSPAVFDMQKFEWMNGVYIRALDPSDLAKRALPKMQAAGLLPERVPADLMQRYVDVVKEVQVRVKTVNDIPAATSYFFKDEIEYDPKAVDKFLRRDYVPGLFAKLIDAFVGLAPFTKEAVEQALDRVGEELGIKKGDLMQPIRVAVTGGTVSPGMYETLALLGRAKTCERLKGALEMVSRG